MSGAARAASPAAERAARSLAALLSPSGRRGRLAVFTYHQVLAARDALRPDEPDVAEFEAEVSTIARVFSVLALPEAAARLRSGTLPARAACITFDDGYANNHELAAPVLERAGVPATFFVTGGAVDDGVMWNDLAIEAVARARDSFSLDGVPSLDAAALEGASGARLVALLLGQLKYRPLAERLAAAQRLYERNAGAAVPRLMMSRAMVADLARRGFDVGGHTLRHPILKELEDDDARAEIAGCGRWIEEVTGIKPRTFAYPNGRPGRDFTSIHAAMVREAGFETAVSTSWQVARGDADLYSIPRVGPWWRHGGSLGAGALRIYAKSYLA